MNAGAYGGEMSKIIVSATTCDRKGDLITYDSRDIRYSYRHSLFMENGEVIVDITLSLKPGNKKDIKALMDDLNNRRRTKQPLEKRSAGSTFKRPDGHFVGQMIEELGLKGFAVGDAAARICCPSSMKCRRRSKRNMAWISIRKYRLWGKHNWHFIHVPEAGLGCRVQ